jgi:Leucine-rich repeat (LRR) protein
MKVYLLLILIFLLTLPLVHGQEVFIKSCKNRLSLGSTTKQTINALFQFYKTKDCTELAKKLSKVKSFHEFIPPAHGSVKQQNLLFPWTDDFPGLYGLKQNYTFKGKDPLTSPYYFNQIEMFPSLVLFIEFTNITVVSLLPSYTYFNQLEFNVCQFISKFPNLKTITIESSLLLNPENDKCLSASKITGVIIRDSFSGYGRVLPKTKILGIEFYTGDLNHIANYRSLRFLGISNQTQALSGVEALAKLSGLSHFSMNIKSINEISMLGNLINLTYLNLTCIDDEKNPISNQGCKIGNYVSEIEFLKDLPWLEHLNLSFSNIDEIGDLSHLTELRYLKLRGNNLINVSKMGLLPKLTYLDLSGNKLEAIENLKVPALKFLNLSGNRLQDFSPIKDLTNLEYLNLSNNNFNKTFTSSVLPPTLRGLNLNGGGGNFHLNEIGLEAYAQILSQGAEKDHSSEIEVIFHDIGPQKKESKMTNCATYPLLAQIPDLSHLKSLEVLSLKNNKLGLMPNLNNLSKLKYLNLTQNGIHDFSQNLLPKNLIHLDFSLNELDSFPLISSLDHLDRIDLRSNNITNIDQIKLIPNSVRLVNVAYNLVTDTRPIEGATGLSTGRATIGSYQFEGNPIIQDVLVGRTLHTKSDNDLEFHRSQKCFL